MVRARGMRQSQTGVAERARVQRARRARAALPARQGAAHRALARHCGHMAHRLILETLFQSYPVPLHRDGLNNNKKIFFQIQVT